VVTDDPRGFMGMKIYASLYSLQRKDHVHTFLS
jgi:hypothetical protein